MSRRIAPKNLPARAGRGLERRKRRDGGVPTDLGLAVCEACWISQEAQGPNSCARNLI